MVALPEGEDKLFSADNVICCVGFKPRRELHEKLLKNDAPWDIYAVGDCVKVENFFHATQAAYQLVQYI